jgi:hypothetical protein
MRDLVRDGDRACGSEAAHLGPERKKSLRAPGYGLVNVNVHYDSEINHPYVNGAVFFFEIKNPLDTT